jgi:hypothetical protein
MRTWRWWSMTSKHWSRKSGIGLIDLIADTSSSWIMHFGLKKKILIRTPDDNCHRHFLAEAQKILLIELNERIKWQPRFNQTSPTSVNTTLGGVRGVNFCLISKDGWKETAAVGNWKTNKLLGLAIQRNWNPTEMDFRGENRGEKNWFFFFKKNSNRYLVARN